jgi:hypothetical protein
MHSKNKPRALCPEHPPTEIGQLYIECPICEFLAIKVNKK